jgi:hypothetical protein
MLPLASVRKQKYYYVAEIYRNIQFAWDMKIIQIISGG